MNKMKKLFILILVSLLINMTSILGNENTKEYTLDNGLKVFLIIDPTASLISVRTYVRAGSILENNLFGSGASHYLEHIVAGGSTEQRSEEEYKNKVSLLGGAFNAYTTLDHTSYYFNTVPNYSKEAITLLYEWMFFCEFKETEFNRERNVIIKEIEKNNANINRVFYYLCQNNLYKYHPIRYPVIGYLENFKSLSKKDLTTYYKEKYVPANMALVIGGNIDEKEILKHIKETFGTIPNFAPSEQIIFNEPPPFSPMYIEKEGETNTTYFSIRFSTTDIFSKDLYPLDLLEFILGNGEESILYKKLVDEKKLAYSVSCASYTPSETTGYFDITFEIDHKNKEVIAEETIKIINNIKKGNLEENFISRAKKQKLSEDIFSINTIEDKVSRVGQSYICTNTKDFYSHYIKSFQKISPENIISVANKYLDFSRAVYTILKPKSEENPNNAAKLLKVKPINTVPKIINLKNGVRLLLYEDKSLPKVYTKIFTLGGIRAENTTDNGIGNLFTDLIGKGSKKYSKDHIQKIIEDNGADLYGTLGNNTAYFSLDCLSDDFYSLFPILTDSFINPNFSQADLDELKRKTYQWIKQRKDDWFGYCNYEFKKSFFENHPYGFSKLGETEVIEQISLSDIYKYHSKQLNPNSIIVSIFGNFDEKKTIEMVNKELIDIALDFKPSEFKKALPRNSHPSKNNYELEIPQDVAAVFIAFDGETFNRSFESLQLDLVDSVLSGMSYPAGRLHSILREKGLVYLVHGINITGLEKGYFLIYALTSKDSAEKVKTIILDQINSIQKELVSDQEFEQAISQLTFYYKDRISSMDSLSIISSADELYGRGFDYYSKIDQHVKLLSKEDILRTSKRYLKNPQVYIFK
jgi:zinc protease